MMGPRPGEINPPAGALDCCRPRKATMSRELQAKSLAKEEVDRAFALIRSAGGQFTLPRWRRYAGELIRRGPAGCGLLAVENGRGTIQGLCSYRMVNTPEGDRHCVVEVIAALDL